MALQAEQLLLDEGWVRGRAAQQQAGSRPEMVQSLNLQGTYSEKIGALGDAFKNFKSLRSLDLSKNVIVSLEGIEYLHSLQHLNLYYNNIATISEIARLHHLPYLKHLDLRLNPVARNEPDYRLAVVHILENLEKMDDRTVRDSERKAAKMHFIMKEEEGESAKPDIKRERAAKSYMFSENQSTKLNSDTCLTVADDVSNRWAYYANMHNVVPVDPVDPLQRVQSSSSKQDWPGTGQPGQNELDDEYRPLPSPARSSLRSPGKCVTSRSKERFQVTFVDHMPLDNEFAVPPINSSSHDSISLTKRLCFSDSDLLPSSEPNEPKDDLYYYRPSTALKKETLKSSEIDKRSSTFRDSSRRPSEELTSTTSRCSYGELREHLDDQSENTRLLNLSSDPYDATHRENKSLLSANHLSTLGKSVRDPLPKLHSYSAESLLEKSPLESMTNSCSSSPTRDKESSVWRTPSPEKRPTLTHVSLDNVSADGELNQVANLNSLLSSKPPTTLRLAEPVSARQNINSSTVHRSQSDSEISSPINIILRQLLDLVDRYWNGSGSLHINQRFLSPAQDLLSILMTSSPSQNRLDNLLVSEESKPPSSKNDIDQYSYAQEEAESLKKKLSDLVKKNHTLQSQLRKFKVAATSNYSGSPNDELQRKNEQLTIQVELLNQQLKPFSNLQETVTLLQESQRSLTSSNEYLLRQLNKSSPQSVKAHLTMDNKKTLDKYSSTESNDTSPITSFYGSGQYRKVDRLSACPL